MSRLQYVANGKINYCSTLNACTGSSKANIESSVLFPHDWKCARLRTIEGNVSELTRPNPAFIISNLPVMDVKSFPRLTTTKTKTKVSNSGLAGPYPSEGNIIK